MQERLSFLTEARSRRPPPKVALLTFGGRFISLQLLRAATYVPEENRKMSFFFFDSSP